MFIALKYRETNIVEYVLYVWHIEELIRSFNFDIEEFRKERLLQGLDDIGITLGYQDKISAYEDEKQNQKPWLFKGE